MFSDMHSIMERGCGGSVSNNPPTIDGVVALSNDHQIPMRLCEYSINDVLLPKHFNGSD
jgi:hypothetical protein